MFKRGNFIAKYKIYAKSLKALQDKAKPKCNILLGNKYENFNDSVKNLVEQSRGIVGENRVLSVAHNKFNETYEKSKKRCAKIAQSLKYHRILPVYAISLVKSDPVAPSGYSQQDYDFLKQLGIVDTNKNSNNANDTNIAFTDTTQTTHTEIPQNDVLDNDDLTLTSTSNFDFSSSLFDTHSNYTSIFDNMPEERNDLYTMLTNTFSFSNEKSTQVSSNDLQPALGVPNTHDSFINDSFIVETPGVQSAAISPEFNPPDDVNDNAFVASPINDVAGAGVGEDEMLEANLLNTNDASGGSVAATGAANVESGSMDFGAKSLRSADLNDNVNDSTDDIVIELIPEPPAVPDLAAEAASHLNAMGEATFASLGLGGWTPVGIVQNCFEYLHCVLGIPWWEAIAIGTLVIRFALFPLVIMSQKNAARMNNHLPQMQVIQMKMTDARQSGNQLEVARYSQELMMFMKEKNLNPFKNMIVPMAQMPVFISFFMGLREMANVPVDSLRTGGMFWFQDLTVPDQFFALPIITSLTLWATVELGTDSARLSSQNLQTMKYVLRALPIVILPFTVNFPGAILCYWVASNFISLGQVGFLRIPVVRDYFNIHPMLKHDQTKLPIQNKGFVGGLKDSWTNIKITKEIEERRRLDEIQFQRAGKGPLVKTYKYDPTKQVKKTTDTRSAIKSSN